MSADLLQSITLLNLNGSLQSYKAMIVEYDLYVFQKKIIGVEKRSGPSRCVVFQNNMHVQFWDNPSNIAGVTPVSMATNSRIVKYRAFMAS
jgi:hypothetical protein